MRHQNIQDPEIHEPKGISTAPAGAVYVSNGAGSGSWEPNAGKAELILTASNFLPQRPTAVDTELTVFLVENQIPIHESISNTNGVITFNAAGKYLFDFIANLRLDVEDGSPVTETKTYSFGTLIDHYINRYVLTFLRAVRERNSITEEIFMTRRYKPIKRKDNEGPINIRFYYDAEVGDKVSFQMVNAGYEGATNDVRLAPVGPVTAEPALLWADTLSSVVGAGSANLTLWRVDNAS